eukprot:357930-Chlamydomonas_euryale.AAC.3
MKGVAEKDESVSPQLRGVEHASLPPPDAALAAAAAAAPSPNGPWPLLMDWCFSISRRPARRMVRKAAALPQRHVLREAGSNASKGSLGVGTCVQNARCCSRLRNARAVSGAPPEASEEASEAAEQVGGHAATWEMSRSTGWPACGGSSVMTALTFTEREPPTTPNFIRFPSRRRYDRQARS